MIVESKKFKTLKNLIKTIFYTKIIQDIKNFSRPAENFIT